MANFINKRTQGEVEETANQSLCPKDEVRYPALIFNLMIMLALDKIVVPFAKRLGQPDMIGNALVGLVVGSAGVDLAKEGLAQLLVTLMDFGMMCYTFALGVEMEPALMFRKPDSIVIISYAGMLSTVFVFVVMKNIVTDEKLGLFISGEEAPSVSQIAAAAFFSSNTASPLLTRLVTELKIGKSEVGRLVISAGVINDMVTMTFGSALAILKSQLRRKPATEKSGKKIKINGLQLLSLLFTLIAEALFILRVIPFLVNWINNKNPAGRPMKGHHLWMAAVVALILCFMPSVFGYDAVMAAFFVGLLFPREGRLSRQLVHKINVLLNMIVFPLFFVWVVVEETTMMEELPRSKQVQWKKDAGNLLARFAVNSAVTTIGKVMGTTIAAIYFKYEWLEAIAMGLLLHVKGQYHIYSIARGRVRQIVRVDAEPIAIASQLLTVMYVPLVVRLIIRRARQKANNRLMTLQMHDPSSELRIMVCLHGSHNVPGAINIIEASRGEAEVGPLTAYVMDLIEMTTRAVSTLTYGEGLDAVAVTDETIVKMRDEITEAIESYAEQSGGGLTVRRLLAISSFDTMHEDVCNAASDSVAMLLILPFHKIQRIDGKMEDFNSKLRHVNQKVLQHAPCTVGILIDRGLGGTNQMSAAYATHQVAVIFISGCDDREALSYASRMAYHPGIKLTAIRFLVDVSAETASISTSARTNTPILTEINSLEREMALDDECFADFYERHVADGRVGYVEKYVTNGAETVANLRALEALYSLFIVGRGGHGRSALTTGMSDWEECPELGAIGDILSSSDFSVTASVLIMQQHDPKQKGQSHHRQSEIDDEFSTM